jgi:hypothetical protein
MGPKMASTAKRWLIGCGIGCIGLIVLVIAAVVGFGMWIQGSGELLEPQKLLGADTTGHIEWTLQLEDPGTEGFAHALIDAVRAIPPEASEQMPAWMVGWLTRMQSRETERDILDLFPMAAAWTVRPGAVPEDDLHLFSLSVERFGNRLVFGDWLMGWLLPRGNDIGVDRYRGEKIYQIPLRRAGKRVTLFLRGGNVFFTSDGETARIAVDRLIADAAPDREPTALDRLFAETAAGGPMRGAIDNRRGEVHRLWSWISSRSESPADRRMWTGFRGLALAGGLQADGSLAANLRFVCPDADSAEAYTPDLVQALQDGLAWTDLALDIQARPVGDRIEIDLRAGDLVHKMQDWLRQAQEIETDSGRVRIDL